MPKKDKAVLEDHPKKGSTVPLKDATQKPTVKKLIGGESWTGKLPVNVLSEHCQKNRWEKPEYSMHRERDGFISHICLRQRKPKSDELLTVPTLKVPQFMKDVATQPSAVEARNFAAAATLFRVCNNLNLHTMMPPQYRNLWKGEFKDMKEVDIKRGCGWMYEVDPFLAYKRQSEQQTLNDKKHLQTDNASMQKSNHSRGACGTGKSAAGRDKLPKPWLQAPRIELGKEVRLQAERLIRKYTLWNTQHLTASLDLRTHWVDDLSRIGFRRNHVEEAIDICQSRTEALEWLIIHVPEDDLPSWCLPDNYAVGISKASDDPQKDILIERLSSTGFAPQMCAQFYDECCGNEISIASRLQNDLLYGDEAFNRTRELDVESEEATNATEWEAEREVISAIYAHNFKAISKEQFQVRLSEEAVGIPNIDVRLMRPIGPYPRVLPILTIHAPLPAYLRLTICKRALLHAKEYFLGSQMIFSIIGWLEEEASNIIKTPGPLSDLIPQVSARIYHYQVENEDEVRNRASNGQPLQQTTHMDRLMYKERQRKLESNQYKSLMKIRESLPAWKMRHSIVQAVNQHQVVLVSGDTGSGKSTQCVQFILDDMIGKNRGSSASIVCTQPRRISAVALAERVAQERCSKVGDEVGFAIRGERKVKASVTKIVYVTTGVILRKFQAMRKDQDFNLEFAQNTSHIFVDEVHERSVEIDFLLLILKELIQKNKNLKVILMSATADADIFDKYFSPTCSVGKLMIEGRAHPVEDLYLEDIIPRTSSQSLNNGKDLELPTESIRREIGRKIGLKGSRIDYDLLAETVCFIKKDMGDENGSILIFLPGMKEIEKLIYTLKHVEGIQCFPLHSSLPSSEQRKIFNRLPNGRRKVIAATNIAETSITIDDVVAVIDTGRVKEMAFDSQTKTSRLQEVWASKASCRQRKGRAGRVRPGKCYKLYTRRLEVETMHDKTAPEILRLPLEQLCLSIKVMGIGDVFDFLNKALTQPDTSAIEDALRALHQVGALKDNNLTALGRHIASIPADLRCGKLLVYGATFGCLEASLTMAAILTSRCPFITNGDHREEAKAARMSFAKGKGDIISDLCAYEAWQSKKLDGVPTTAINGWCKVRYLSPSTLDDIASNRDYFLSSLIEARWVPSKYVYEVAHDSPMNEHGKNHTLLQAILAAALNPYIARISLPEKKFAAGIAGSIEMDPEARKIKYFDRYSDRIFIHPGSTTFDAQGYGSASFISFWTKMQTNKCFAREVTPFNAYSLLLFCGDISYDENGRGLTVDDWWKLRGWMRIGVLVSRLRIILDDLLNRKANDPTLDISSHEAIKLCRRLIELNGLDI